MKVDKLDKITLINGDCMEYMRTLPDNAYNLAIVDPPYGDGGNNGSVYVGGWGGQITHTEAGLQDTRYNRFGGRFARYSKPRMYSVGVGGDEKRVERTGETWAAKYGAGGNWKKHCRLGYCT